LSGRKTNAPTNPHIAMMIVKYKQSIQDDSLQEPQQPKNPTMNVKRPIPMMQIKNVE
jgi:hypothetical protein